MKMEVEVGVGGGAAEAAECGPTAAGTYVLWLLPTLIIVFSKCFYYFVITLLYYD